MTMSPGFLNDPTGNDRKGQGVLEDGKKLTVAVLIGVLLCALAASGTSKGQNQSGPSVGDASKSKSDAQQNRSTKGSGHASAKR